MGEIKKANVILQKAFKRMQRPNKQWDNVVTEVIPSVNEQLGEDKGFTPSKVLLGFHLYLLI